MEIIVGQPRKIGRNPFEPTEEQRANGELVETIACAIGIDMKTLNKHFRIELAEGKATVVAAIGVSVVKAALAGDLFAACCWLSCFRGSQSARGIGLKARPDHGGRWGDQGGG